MEIDTEKPGTSSSDSVIECVESFKASILDQLGRIADCLNDEDLQKDYTKKDGKINWKKMREIMRRELATELKEEWERMWEEEDLTAKLVSLKTLTNNTQSNTKAWRPKTGDINPQKLALEKKKLLFELEYLKKICSEKEEHVTALKTKLTKDWKEIADVRERIFHHNKTMDVIQTKISEELDAHYNNDIFSTDSVEELKRDIQDTTLHGYLDDVVSEMV